MLVSFANEKGGAGKSTDCVSLAGAYAARGERVHIIDTDSNLTAIRWLTGLIVTDAVGQTRRLGQDDYIEIPQQTPMPNLTITRPSRDRLFDHLKVLNNTYSYDHIFIDLPGERSEVNLKASLRSDLVIIPTPPHEAGWNRAERTAKDLAELLQTLNRPVPYRLLIGQVQSLASTAQAVILRTITESHIPKFATPFFVRAAYQEIGLMGKPPHAGDRNRETIAKAIIEIDAVVDEIETIMHPVAPAKEVA